MTGRRIVFAAACVVVVSAALFVGYSRGKTASGRDASTAEMVRWRTALDRSEATNRKLEARVGVLAHDKAAAGDKSLEKFAVGTEAARLAAALDRCISDLDVSGQAGAAKVSCKEASDLAGRYFAYLNGAGS